MSRSRAMGLTVLCPIDWRVDDDLGGAVAVVPPATRLARSPTPSGGADHRHTLGTGMDSAEAHTRWSGHPLAGDRPASGSAFGSARPTGRLRSATGPSPARTAGARVQRCEGCPTRRRPTALPGDDRAVNGSVARHSGSRDLGRSSTMRNPGLPKGWARGLFTSRSVGTRLQKTLAAIGTPVSDTATRSQPGRLQQGPCSQSGCTQH